MDTAAEFRDYDKIPGILRQVEILAVDSAAEFPPDNSYIVFIYGISLYIVRCAGS